MKIAVRIFTLMTLIMVTSAGQAKIYAQKIVKIGEAEIAIQAPLTIKKADASEEVTSGLVKSKYPRMYEHMFIGIAMAVPTGNQEYLPMHYGNSYNLEVGFKYFYRPSAGYAIGTICQYTFYTYKLKDAAANGTFFTDIPGEVKKEYFRTDNLGTGIINRFYLFPLKHKPFMIDLGGYVDFSYSKRYNVKTVEAGKNIKHKYRDGSKFNPIQTGLYGAISKGSYSLYARYRITNLFNPAEVPMELPRLSIGIQKILD